MFLFFTAWSERLTTILHWIGAILLIPMVVVVVVGNAILRYGFNSPLPYGEEVTGLILLLVFISVIPFCTHFDRQIKIDLLYKGFSPGVKRISDALTSIAGLSISLLIAWQAAIDVPEMIEFETSGDISNIPFWPFSAALSVFGVLLSVLFLLKFSASLAGRKGS